MIVVVFPSSHNHGSVENGSISNLSFLLFKAIFHFHDYGRKDTYTPYNGVLLTQGLQFPCESELNHFSSQDFTIISVIR